MVPHLLRYRRGAAPACRHIGKAQVKKSMTTTTSTTTSTTTTTATTVPVIQ
jgi:hypothetical protein